VQESPLAPLRMSMKHEPELELKYKN
jgi:hypothetical protein